MGIVKTIYLSEEVNKKLKSVDNVSGLINELLINHFESPEKRIDRLSVDELSKRKEEIEKGKKEKIDNELKIIDELITEKKITEEEAEQKAKVKKAEMIKGFTDSFINFFEVNNEEAQELAEEFYQKRNKTTIFDLGKEKGLTEKQ